MDLTPNHYIGEAVKLKMDFNGIEQEPLLADKETIIYWHLMLKETGDVEWRDKLFRSHIKWVRKVANKFAQRYNYQVINDLYQEGCMGLLKAIDGFEPSKGTLSTYSLYWIEEYLISFLLDNCRNIRLPKYLQYELFNLRKAHAKQFNSTEGMTERLMELEGFNEASFTSSMEESVAPDGSSKMKKKETFVAYDSNIEQIFYSNQVHEKCRQYLIEHFSESTANVIALLFGTTPGTYPLSHKEVSSLTDISVKAVKKIERQVLQNRDFKHFVYDLVNHGRH